jgi:sugar diacid utilization regulator
MAGGISRKPAMDAASAGGPSSGGTHEPREHLALLRSLEAVSAVAQDADDAHSALTDLLRVITEISPWRICWAALFDSSAERVLLQHGSGFGVPFSTEAYDGWPVEGSLSAQAIESGQPLEIADIEQAGQHPLVQADAAIRGFRSALIVPLRTTSHLNGILWLCGPAAHEISDTERVLAYAVASHVATALVGAHALVNNETASTAVAADGNGLARLHETTIQQKEHLERISAIHERLMQQVLNDHGLEQLGELAAQLLERPVLLFDRFDHVVYASGGLAPVSTGQVEELLGPQLRIGFTNRPARAAFATVGDDRFLVVPIASEGRALGNLCVHYGEATAADLDVQIAEQVGLFFALELLKERIRLDVALRLDGDFFASLLSNDAKPPERLLEQAGLRGLDLERPSVVIRARVSPPPVDDWFDITANVAWRLRSLMAQYGAHATAVTYPARGAEMVMIVNGDPLPSVREQVLPTVRAAVAENLKQSGARPFTISTGVGIVGRGLDGLRASHEASIKALSVVDMLGMEGSDIDLSDFAAYGLLLSIPPEQRADYVRTVLGVIIDYDRAHSAEFIKTLESYLESFGSVQRTAEKLFLHPTTVRYRLGRIEELSGFQLDNAEHRLSLAVALRLHRVIQQR